MKQIKTWTLAFTYVGCFLGAGFISGQELWQFFGRFGENGFWGLLLAMALFLFFGILLLRLIQLTGIDQAVAICVKGRLVRRHRRCRRRAHIQ